MLDKINTIIGKTKDNDDTRITCKNVHTEDNYTKYQFSIHNQDNTLMGTFEIDKTEKNAGSLLRASIITGSILSYVSSNLKILNYLVYI